MGRAFLFGRLAAKDLRRHLSEAVLLFLVIAAAAATLTMGLVLHGETSNPYDTTQAATNGPDAVANLSPTLSDSGSVRANANPADLAALESAPGVVGHSGPYPTTFALLDARGMRTSAMVEGRDLAPATLAQPALTAGSWIRDGGVVIERSFADALGVQVGDAISLRGRPYRVAGIAVDAATAPYPHVCAGGWCDVIYRPSVAKDQISQYQPGVIWLPRSDAVDLAAPDIGLSYLLNLKLTDPAQAPAFAASRTHTSSPGSPVVIKSRQEISTDAAKLVRGPHTVLLVGSGLLILLALASVTVLVGGRLAEQTRRVGLLKAVGATPGTVAILLLVEHLAVTLVAAAAGLAIGWDLAPLLTSPGAGLLGAPGTPPITVSTVAAVVGVALAVAALATVTPALQAARTSTVNALADTARPPRRSTVVNALSTHLPVPLLLGVRLAARRPRRLALSTLSVTVTEAGIIAIVMEHARLGGTSGLVNPQNQRMTQVMLVITVMLIALAAVNAVLITWATVFDARRASALARALGATPQQVTAALIAAQLVAVLPGSVLGVPLGMGLLKVVTTSGDAYKLVPSWWFLLVVLGTWLVTSALIAIPARFGGRLPTARILRAELS
ncbi:putative ABC transport system permease protein [Kribbella aluminosa]|uniref:ABC transport system permease protein n=1 Tax=Kribbella aluminosa TaxID=416017 RepID=A0ABS4UNP1_9ACTN|nr:ABC transporter permease [Kribbella aluminosa]MBP2353239.1 putative ABC transport system permease protein [Kribbella aluminosa]